MTTRLTFLLLIIITAGIFLSLSAKPQSGWINPFAITIYYYQGNCQRIKPGIYGQDDSKENSLSCSELMNTSNWSKAKKNTIASGNYIAAISFDEEKDEDGCMDGQLTLTEALIVLCDYYTSKGQYDLPRNGGSIVAGRAEIIVHRKAAT